MESDGALALSPADLDVALDHCARVAGRKDNHLVAVSQRLDVPVKRALFVSCYAVMRVLDDAVDEQFLARSRAAGQSSRRAMEAFIDRWLEQALAAAAGRFRSTPQSYEPLVFAALNHFAGASQLGMGPWQDLAGAMRSDVREHSLATWDDFDAYCRGATVAPASVFIYVLACRAGGDAETRFDLPSPPEHYARDMAIFCYLVHILRDLSMDAAKDAQLITLPETALSAAHLDKQSLRQAVAAGDIASVQPLVNAVLARARRYLPAIEQRRAELGRLLGATEHRILEDLFARYLAVFEAIGADYTAFLAPRNRQTALAPSARRGRRSRVGWGL